jgi:hemerythrin-like metal-binding protein
MAFIQWSNQYKINVEEVDEQHQVLIRLINELYDAVVKGSDKLILAKILNELVDYTGYHFNTEEELMSLYRYPGFEHHKVQHDELAQQVHELKDNYSQGKSIISFEVLVFLNDWLINHILDSDQKYADYLNARGVF